MGYEVVTPNSEFNSCDICLERTCLKKAEGKDSKDCVRELTVTVRITLNCTQSCKHCCFECSPSMSSHMSVDRARDVAIFLRANGIVFANVMGGEVFCNPDWREVTALISSSVEVMRIVSNGDWADSCPEFAEHVASLGNCYVSLSKDSWHTNKHVALAKKLLLRAGVTVKVSGTDVKEEHTVPVGRSRWNHGFYSYMGCYCRRPERMYSFMIDEVGRIYKCGFGVWHYDEIDDYMDGGFRERFKHFSTVFYKTLIMSCGSCIEAYSRTMALENREGTG